MRTLSICVSAIFALLLASPSHGAVILSIGSVNTTGIPGTATVDVTAVSSGAPASLDGYDLAFDFNGDSLPGLAPGFTFTGVTAGLFGGATATPAVAGMNFDTVIADSGVATSIATPTTLFSLTFSVDGSVVPYTTMPVDFQTSPTITLPGPIVLPLDFFVLSGTNVDIASSSGGSVTAVPEPSSFALCDWRLPGLQLVDVVNQKQLLPSS